MNHNYKDLKQKHNFKLTVVGDTGSGKTCIIGRYIKDIFYKEGFPTIAGEYSTKSIKTKDNIVIKAQIWDTSGQEVYNSISNIHFSKCKGVIIVYDITNKKSFDKIENWLLRIKKHCDRDCLIMVVGNKLDILNEDPSKREVPEQVAKDYAIDNKLYFKEVSAKNNTKINEIFEDMLNEIYNNYTNIPEIKDHSHKKSNFTSIEDGSNANKGSSYCFCF